MRIANERGITIKLYTARPAPREPLDICGACKDYTGGKCKARAACENARRLTLLEAQRRVAHIPGMEGAMMANPLCDMLAITSPAEAARRYGAHV